MKRRFCLCGWVATVVWLASGSLFGNEFLAPPDAGQVGGHRPGPSGRRLCVPRRICRQRVRAAAGLDLDRPAGHRARRRQIRGRPVSRRTARRRLGSADKADAGRRTARQRSGAERRGRRVGDLGRPIRVHLQQRWPAARHVDQAATRQSDDARRSAAQRPGSCSTAPRPTNSTEPKSPKTGCWTSAE